MIHASITELKQGGHSLFGLYGEAAPEMVRVYQRICGSRQKTLITSWVPLQ